MADAKKPAKKKKGASLGKLYEKKEGTITRKNTFCPKCGQGYFLAKHKDRVVCGKCKYVEYTKK